MKKYILFIIILIIICIIPFIKTEKIFTYYEEKELEKISIDLENITSSTYYTYDENTLTITKSGEYILSGNTNLNIVINSNGIVYLTLNDVTITSENYAIYVKKAQEVLIKLNGDNTLINKFDNDMAVIYSEEDLIIKGSGTLNINSISKGIKTKSLQILSGNLNINSVSTSIKAKNYVVFKEENINITSKDNGIKAENIIIDDGIFNIDSVYDNLDAEDITINNGEFVIKTTSTTDSSKGIKATNSIEINNGIFTIDTVDDSIHADNVLINGGEFNITTLDDGIHADSYLKINAGTINILNSYEGLEANYITINSGEIYVISSDDGINIAGGDSNKNDTFSSSSGVLTINGGFIYVDASGDGLDSNGSIVMNGGTVIVSGPVNDFDGALDYDGTFKITGGTLIAAGSSGMLECVSENSTQYSLTINFGSTKEANSVISIKDSNENEIITFAPSKEYSSIVISTPDLGAETYSIYVDGTSDSDSIYGLYELGSYSGILYKDVSINSYITTVGNISNRDFKR